MPAFYNNINYNKYIPFYAMQALLKIMFNGKLFMQR